MGLRRQRKNNKTAMMKWQLKKKYLIYAVMIWLSSGESTRLNQHLVKKS